MGRGVVVSAGALIKDLRYSKFPRTPWNPWPACLISHLITRVSLSHQPTIWFSVEKQFGSQDAFISESCARSKWGLPTTPQSCFAEYIGKHGASVPSTRTITVFCPARQF